MSAPTKYEEMNAVVQAVRQNWLATRQRCLQYAVTLLNEFCTYCQIPNQRLNLLRWNGESGQNSQFAKPDSGRYHVPQAIEFNEEDGFWQLGIEITFDGMQWVFFALCIGDRSGSAAVRIGPTGKVSQIDVNDPNQRNEFYEGIIAMVKKSFQEGRREPTIGFSIGPQVSETE